MYSFARNRHGHSLGYIFDYTVIGWLLRSLPHAAGCADF